MPRLKLLGLLRSSGIVCVFFISVAVCLLSISAPAKDVILTAIELFDGPNGAAYVQLTDIMINGKTELRSCASAEKIDKSDYGHLPKVSLVGANTLQRNAKGVLVLTSGAESICVVPTNLKVEKDWGTNASDFADHAVLTAKVLSSSPAGIDAPAPLKVGVKLVFVAEPDTELAEYLRADRANSIAAWQDYLGRYPKAAHVEDGKRALAALFEKEGQDSLAAYRKSSSSSSPAYAELKKAWLREEQAKDLVKDDAAAAKLRNDILAELGALATRSKAELQAYQDALSKHAAGYKHLATARDLSDHVLDVNSQFDDAQTLAKNIASEQSAVETAMRSAESLAGSQRYDEALAALTKYRSFADEEPRIAAIVNATYKFHFEQGKNFESQQKWAEAVQNYRQATEIAQTSDAVASLKNASANLETTTNRAAADSALQKSTEFEQQQNFIDAYEVLSDLPDAQRVLVDDRMKSLEAQYVKAASDEAKKLQEAHTPMHGKADEIGIQRAYELLSRSSSLSDDQNLKIRLDLLSDIISDYYMDQAKRYIEKPLGSGVGMGWVYLDEAQQYKPNRDDVHDERTKSSSVHYLRSKLSIRVVFRDQTSRRDSAGFADQLSDAIATGLETSGLPVKVVRSNDTTTVEPNFQLIGDVVQHRPVITPTIEPMESKYRAGEREMPNDDWNRANRDYEAASLDLQNAQKVLEGAQARGKKKDIAEANAAVQSAQQRVEDAHSKLDTIPKTIPNDVIKPYTYTKKTYDLSAVVELAFRIVDSGGNIIDAITPITRTAKKSVVVLENVKSEDTEGVRAQGSPPDELQFLTDLEIEARDELIKEVKDKVEGLPTKVLAQARQRVTDGDMDGAAEAYILYLNSTPDVDTSERLEAKRFLQQQFNVTKVASSAS